MTGGLVQDISHTVNLPTLDMQCLPPVQVLPSVPPLSTAILSLLSMLPALLKLWRSPHSLTQFLR